MRMLIHSSIVAFLFHHAAYCQLSTTPGGIETYQTINSIGIEWKITGDENHNAQCRVQYRKRGAAAWESGLPLYRIDYNGNNMMAGSILFLDSLTSYKIELALHDSDGGTAAETLEVTTRKVPRMPAAGKTYYVSPGNGGGTGKSDDPFLGIEAAQKIAKPGDVFLLKSGNYASGTDDGKIQFTVSGAEDEYVVWKADDGALPILCGARIHGHFIWLEGITIQNQQYGILVGTSAPNGIVITKSHFKGCHYGIYLNHGGKNWYITDNVIEGDIPDYTSGAMDGEGVELQHSDGCVVAYNKIFNTADGVSYPGKNCDIFRNEIYNVSDDGIELDYGRANNRVWENRITNANNNGITFQPMSGSPMYVIRNQVYVHEESALKLRDGVDRALIAHNTFVCWCGVVSVNTAMLVGFHSNNNLWISVTDRYVWEDNAGSTAPNWRTNLDYDGFDWNNNQLAFKWKGERLASLEAFQAFSGLETHGIRVRKNELFEKCSFPEKPNPMPLQYLTLKAGCNGIDAGIVLNNISVGYNGKAPDLGAFEYGSTLPVYGPRNGTAAITHTPDKKACDELHQSSFNISNSMIIVHYTVPATDDVTITLYDINGKKMKTLLHQAQQAGSHRIACNGTDLHNGMYYCRIKTGKHSQIKKLGVLRY